MLYYRFGLMLTMSLKRTLTGPTWATRRQTRGAFKWALARCRQGGEPITFPSWWGLRSGSNGGISFRIKDVFTTRHSRSELTRNQENLNVSVGPGASSRLAPTTAQLYYCRCQYPNSERTRRWLRRGWGGGLAHYTSNENTADAPWVNIEF